ncbi:MAG: hypothetical protein WCP35_18655, partial [Verrucomicrobiota bacterium]
PSRMARGRPQWRHHHPSGDSRLQIQRRHKLSMWEGKQPTASAFLRQLENPLQVQGLADEWQIDAPLAMLSQKLFFVSPFWNRKQADIRRSLRAYGMSEVDVEKLIVSFDEVHKHAMRLKENQSDRT